MVRRIFSVAIVVGVASLAAAQQAAAATTTTVGCSGLQSALNSAATGDTVVLDQLCSDMSFTITNTNAFTLEGAADDSNGNPTDGFDGGASNDQILSSSADVKLTIENLLFENATLSNGQGSAIFLGYPTNPALTITHDTFENNSDTDGYGGAVAIEGSAGEGTSQPVISDNTFKDNAAGDAGALYLDGGSKYDVEGNTFLGNMATSGYGGALDLEDYANGYPATSNPVTISGNTFGTSAIGAGNAAEYGGGGAFVSVQPGQTVTMSGNDFTGNAVAIPSTTADGDVNGGGLMLNTQNTYQGFTAVQSNNQFIDNTVSEPTSSPSSYRAGGGGEWVSGVSVRSTADVFSDNQLTTSGAPAPEGGGLGILGTDTSNTNYVPGVFVGADDLFIVNSVTQANAWGGAIYTGGLGGNCGSSASCQPSQLTLYDSTIFDNSVNSSSGQGAAIWGGPSDSLTLENSIVYGNTGQAGAAEIYGYSSPTYSYDDACTTAGGSTALSGSGNICANPELGVTGDETSTSPTIDKGSNSLVPSGLTTDVEGNPRITEGLASSCQAIVDMGAYESPAVAPGPSCPYTLSVAKAGSGSGTVTSADGGINCGSTCSHSYTNGTTVTLTATPAPGSTFAGWTFSTVTADARHRLHTAADPMLLRTCSGTATCTVTMSSDQSVTATFTANATPPTSPPTTTTGPTLTTSGPTLTTTPLVAMSGLKIVPHKVSIAGRRVGGRCAKVTNKNKDNKRCRRAITLTISYTLNIPAAVKITLQKLVPGREQNGKCVKPTNKNRKHRKCTRLVNVKGSLNKTGLAGGNSFIWKSRIGGGNLPPGTYRLTATPTANGQTGTPQQVTFKIVG